MDEEGGGYDSVQVTEHDSWFSRMGQSAKGLCFGPLLMFASIILLFWNEGRNVYRMKDLNESAKLVQSLQDVYTISDSNEGQLIHITGKVQADAYLYDEDFGVTADAIKLSREVETYQWVEDVDTRTKKNAGGSTSTTKTYNYHREWASGLENSDYFQESYNHENPDAALFEDNTLTAQDVSLGAFALSDTIVGSMSWYSQVTDLSVDNIPEGGDAENAVLLNHMFYFADDTSTPAVGDTRVSFYSVPTGTISIIGEQSGQAVSPYYTKRGGTVMLVEKGTVSAQEMINHALTENTMITWILRAVGFGVSFAGFTMLMGPLTTMTDVIPFVGNIMEQGVVPCLGIFVSGTISITVIAIAWLFYRPLIGLALLLVVGVAVYFVLQRVKKHKQDNEDNGDQPYYQAESAQGSAHYPPPPKYNQQQPVVVNATPVPYNQQQPPPFSQALDAAPPPQQQQFYQNPPPTAPQQVVQGTVVAEPEIQVASQPYVPGVYKPFG